jgi:hypothetical protein
MNQFPPPRRIGLPYTALQGPKRKCDLPPPRFRPTYGPFAPKPNTVNNAVDFLTFTLKPMRFFLFLIFALLSNAAFAGYDLHITRKNHWADEKGSRIGLAEWRSYVKRDKEVRRDEKNSENDFIVSIGADSFPLWYEPKLGELRTKDPSKKAIEKLTRIAAHLRAKVQGDDGEQYLGSSVNRPL